MVNGKSKMYTYNHTWYENFPKRNKIMFLEYYPHKLLMILTYMSKHIIFEFKLLLSLDSFNTFTKKKKAF